MIYLTYLTLIFELDLVRIKTDQHAELSLSTIS